MRSGGIVMTEPRSVVITGASRGLGLASATHLYNRGWRVVGAMRNPELGLDRIRESCGASSSDARLLGVQLDLTNTESIASGAKAIEQAVGAPYAWCTTPVSQRWVASRRSASTSGTTCLRPISSGR